MESPLLREESHSAGKLYDPKERDAEQGAGKRLVSEISSVYPRTN